MALSDTVAKIRAARPGNLDVWKQAIEAGVVLAADVKQGDIPYHAEPRVPGNQWISLNACMPDEAKTAEGGYSLEAWCDTEGTFDIEVPRHLHSELADWVESQGIMCARILSFEQDRAQLSLGLYMSPPQQTNAPDVTTEV